MPITEFESDLLDTLVREIAQRTGIAIRDRDRTVFHYRVTLNSEAKTREHGLGFPRNHHKTTGHILWHVGQIAARYQGHIVIRSPIREDRQAGPGWSLSFSDKQQLNPTEMAARLALGQLERS